MVHELVEISTPSPEPSQVREAVRIFSDEVRNAGGHVWTTITIADGKYAVCEAVFRSADEWSAFKKSSGLRKKPGENASTWKVPWIRTRRSGRKRNGYSRQIEED